MDVVLGVDTSLNSFLQIITSNWGDDGAIKRLPIWLVYMMDRVERRKGVICSWMHKEGLRSLVLFLHLLLHLKMVSKF